MSALPTPITVTSMQIVLILWARIPVSVELDTQEMDTLAMVRNKQTNNQKKLKKIKQWIHFMLMLNEIECNNNLWNLFYVDGLTAMFYLETLPLLYNAWLNTKAGIWTMASFWPKGMCGILISVCWHVCYLPRDANFYRHRKTLSFEEHICMHGISAIVVRRYRNQVLFQEMLFFTGFCGVSSPFVLI